MNSQPIEGFWASRIASTGANHYFVIDAKESLCGAWTLAELSGARYDRRPGKDDCTKCREIYLELHAPPSAAGKEPAWTVKSDPIEGLHRLLYQGEEQSASRGPGGLATQKELAALFNRNGTAPKKKKGKARCAADTPNPEKYLKTKARQSPELPLENAAEHPTSNAGRRTKKQAPIYKTQDLEGLITYLESLFDESPINAVKKPDYFDQVSREIDVTDERTLKILRWLWLTPAKQMLPCMEWMAWMAGETDKEIPHPDAIDKLEGGAEWDLSILELTEILRIARFVFQFPTPSTINHPPLTNKTMSSKAKPFTSQPVDVALPPAEEKPASQFRRSPDNRTITKEQIDKMSDSIREVGILQPVTARPVTDAKPGGVQFEIVLGECRWLGCHALDKDYPVPCFIRNLTDKEASRIRAIENFQRKDLDEIEEARALQNLKETGWTIEEMMAFLGREKSHIYQRLTLLKLSDEAHGALRDGNISIHTAVKLAGLPEEQRDAALKAVVSPTHAAKALPERQALDLLEREFIEPAKLAKDWEKRREAVLENHPGAKWLPYEEARALSNYKSGYVNVDNFPGYDRLSDAARQNELIVPTWGDLAKKHGAPLTIGIDYNDEANAYVQPDPIVEAEKAACSGNPSECIFVHEAAVFQAREAAEQRKLEKEAHTAALVEESKRLVAMILDPAEINKTATKKLVEGSFFDVAENYVELNLFAATLGIDIDAEQGLENAEAAVTKFLRNKNFTPFEAAGRLFVAGWICDSYVGQYCELMFESGAAKAAEFPAHYKEYAERLAAKKQMEREQEALDAAKEDAA